MAGRPDTIGVWVKGNSSWGNIHFELEDADGEVWMSANTAGCGTDVYDWPSLTAFNFDGWHLIIFPLTAKSPVKISAPGANEWQWAHDGSGDRELTWLIKIRGLAVEMPAWTIVVSEMQKIEPVIRLKEIVTF